MVAPADVRTYTKLPGPKWGGNWARFANMPNMGARSYKSMWQWSVAFGGPTDGDEYQFEDLRYGQMATIQFVDTAPVVPDPLIDYIVIPVVWDEVGLAGVTLAIVGYLTNRGFLASRAPKDPALAAKTWVIIVNAATGSRTNGIGRTPTRWPYEFVGPDVPLSGPQVVSGAPRGEAPGLLTAIGLIPYNTEEFPEPDPNLMRGGLVTMCSKFQYRW